MDQLPTAARRAGAAGTWLAATGLLLTLAGCGGGADDPAPPSGDRAAAQAQAVAAADNPLPTRAEVVHALRRVNESWIVNHAAPGDRGWARATCNMLATDITDDWWWVDALQMAMPVFARFAVLRNDSACTEHMYRMYGWTKRHEGGGLYDTTRSL